MEAFLQQEALIREDVSRAFQDLAFFLEDQDGDVDGVGIELVEILHPHLTKLDGRSASIEFEAVVEFDANLTYADPEQSAYDSETGDLYVFGELERRVKRNRSVDARAVLAVDFDSPEQSELMKVELLEDEIGVVVEDDY